MNNAELKLSKLNQLISDRIEDLKESLEISPITKSDRGFCNANRAEIKFLEQLKSVLQTSTKELE